MNMTINAFGRKVSRDEAYQIIINDFMCNIVYARNYDDFSSLLIGGWKALGEWSDKDLEDYISELSKENQPAKQVGDFI